MNIFQSEEYIDKIKLLFSVMHFASKPHRKFIGTPDIYNINNNVVRSPRISSDDSPTEGRPVGQLHSTDRAAERFSLSETHLASYETVAAHPALETLSQRVPVLVSQRHSLVLNKLSLTVIIPLNPHKYAKYPRNPSKIPTRELSWLPWGG